MANKFELLEFAEDPFSPELTNGYIRWPRLKKLLMFENIIKKFPMGNEIDPRMLKGPKVKRQLVKVNFEAQFPYNVIIHGLGGQRFT
jgi:hypothetical protein